MNANRSGGTSSNHARTTHSGIDAPPYTMRSMLEKSRDCTSSSRATRINIVGTMQVYAMWYRSIRSTARAASNRSMSTMGLFPKSGLYA